MQPVQCRAPARRQEKQVAGLVQKVLVARVDREAARIAIVDGQTAAAVVDERFISDRVGDIARRIDRRHACGSRVVGRIAIQQLHRGGRLSIVTEKMLKVAGYILLGILGVAAQPDTVSVDVE